MKFKVGNFVRVKNSDYQNMDGLLGIVMEVDHDSTYPYDVAIIKRRDRYVFLPSELKCDKTGGK